MLKWLLGSVLVTKIDRLGTYAAAMAYCLVLSVVPFLVVTFTLATQLKLDLSRAYRQLLEDILPSGFDATQIVSTLEKSSQGNFATVGFIFAVYTSYNLMTQIVRTLLFVFDDPRKPQGWHWSHWLKSLVLQVLWMLLLLVISLTSILSPVIENLLKQVHLSSEIWEVPVLLVQYMVVLTAMFGAFFLTFLLVPARRPSLDEARDGSMVASCGWILCSLLFAKLMPKLLGAGAVYQALGSVVIILLWAQACAWSVIIGACWIVRFSSRR